MLQLLFACLSGSCSAEYTIHLYRTPRCVLVVGTFFSSPELLRGLEVTLDLCVGMGTLFPWNAFITACDYFEAQYPVSWCCGPAWQAYILGCQLSCEALEAASAVSCTDWEWLKGFLDESEEYI